MLHRILLIVGKLPPILTVNTTITYCEITVNWIISDPDQIFPGEHCYRAFCDEGNVLQLFKKMF